MASSQKGSDMADPEKTCPMTESPAVEKMDEWTVDWDGEDDPLSPFNIPSWRKWASVLVLAIACICVTSCSSMAANTYPGMERDLAVSREVCVLSVSLFVTGLGSGPLVLGPISEFIGRSMVLYCGFGAFCLLNFPVAFANNIAVHLIFRFLTGFAGSAFLSVSGGVVSDIFPNAKVGTPMMVFSTAPFLGPVLGPVISGFINQRTGWRWTYYTVIIWAAVVLLLLMLLVRETFGPELLRRKAIAFGQQLYTQLGAVGGTCLLGGIMVLTVPLPFVFHKYGARIRAKSDFASHNI
ncbi:hypothetical protein P7C73_g2377, partial [Tremellales sp. Uapishka_1]